MKIYRWIRKNLCFLGQKASLPGMERKGANVLAKNRICRMELTDLNNLGYGVGRCEGQVVFVAGGVAGDLVDVRLIRVASGYAVGRIERMLAPSVHRIESACPAAGCGGCAYRNVDAAEEKRLKENGVHQAFIKQGLPEVGIRPMCETGSRLHYRNKAQYPVTPGPKGGCVIGFYAPRSHRVVAAENCPLQDPAFGPLVECLHGLLERYGIAAYDEKTRQGLVRHIYLRRGSESGEILLTLVVNGEHLPHAGEIVSALRERTPDLVGVLLNVNTADTNVICGERYIPLWGRGYLCDRLCGVELRMTPASFYQVNHAGAELLYTLAREEACLRGDELVLDLYCGIGSIGLSMARYVRQVIGIESVEEAVACARENAARNGIRNAAFYCGDAETTEGLLSEAEKSLGERLRPDVVILDPPRRGCDATLLDYLGRLGPDRILYISCNPETLARDIRRLMGNGYAAGEVTPVNLFPMTGHVECVCALRKRG